MEEKVVGIMGGMGPEATADLFRKILAATPAKTDQEHLRRLGPARRSSLSHDRA